MNIFKRIFCKEQKPTTDFTQLYVLKADKYPCDKCQIENKHCYKLIFADRTICVAPKDKINTFRAKPKRASKPAAKI